MNILIEPDQNHPHHENPTTLYTVSPGGSTQFTQFVVQLSRCCGKILPFSCHSFYIWKKKRKKKSIRSEKIYAAKIEFIAW